MPMSPSDYVKRLDAISVYEGVRYGRVHMIFEEESAYGAKVADTMRGYLALSDAFKGFFLETVARLNTECRPKVKSALSEMYPLFVARLTNNMQSLVGAERLALHGYPLQAYTLHRNTFDNAVLTAAVLQKITDFHAIEGVEPGKPLDLTTPGLKALKRQRQQNEWAVQDVMLGKDSGLSAETIEELKKIDDTYDLEVHGSRLSLAGAMGWMKGTEPLSVVPAFKPTDFSLHMNRYIEVAWMVHRLVPAIQPPEAPLAEDWQKKWSIIDDSFEVSIASITEELGKKFGAAVVEFVKTKLPFNAGSVFPL